MQARFPLVATLAVCSSALAQPRIGQQVRVDAAPAGAAANEPSAAASEADPLTIVAGWNDARDITGIPDEGRVGFSLSFDGGATWPGEFLLSVPNPPAFHREGDPMTAVDPGTGTVWVGWLQQVDADTGPISIQVARFNDVTMAFDLAVTVDVDEDPPIVLDKPWMAAGPHLDDDPHLTRLYVGYRAEFSPVVRIRSLDWDDLTGEVATVNPIVTLNPGTAPLPRVGPTGNLYLTSLNQNKVLFTRSTNGGVNFDPESILVTRNQSWPGSPDCEFVPGHFRIPQFNYLAVAPAIEPGGDDTLYVVYMDSPLDDPGNIGLFLIKSVNSGLTWSATPSVVDFDPDSPGDQFFPWIEVDRQNRLHVLFLDTRDPPQVDSATNAMIHVYYMYSENGGDTWTEFRLTEEPWDSINNGWPPVIQAGFIGDYLGMAVAGHRVFPMYPDASNGTDTDIFTNVIDFCPSDCGGSELDGTIDDMVNVIDLLDLLAQWDTQAPNNCTGGSCDTNNDGCVDVVDLLAVLGAWGICPMAPVDPPLTLEEELEYACLTQDDWDNHEAVMTDPYSSEADKARYDCWMRHYMMDCTKCECEQQSNCPAPDPFS